MYIVESERVHCQRKDHLETVSMDNFFEKFYHETEEEFAGSRKDSQNR